MSSRRTAKVAEAIREPASNERARDEAEGARAEEQPELLRRERELASNSRTSYACRLYIESFEYRAGEADEDRQGRRCAFLDHSNPTVTELQASANRGLR